MKMYSERPRHIDHGTFFEISQPGRKFRLHSFYSQFVDQSKVLYRQVYALIFDVILLLCALLHMPIHVCAAHMLCIEDTCVA